MHRIVCAVHLAVIDVCACACVREDTVQNFTSQQAGNVGWRNTHTYTHRYAFQSLLSQPHEIKNQPLKTAQTFLFPSMIQYSPLYCCVCEQCIGQRETG